jgi:hypothetical protein
MTNGENSGNEIIKKKTCQYCYKVFPKEEMIGNKTILYSCKDCYNNKQTSIEMKLFHGAIYIGVSGLLIMLMLFIIAFCATLFNSIKEKRTLDDDLLTC